MIKLSKMGNLQHLQKITDLSITSLKIKTSVTRWYYNINFKIVFFTKIEKSRKTG